MIDFHPASPAFVKSFHWTIMPRRHAITPHATEAAIICGDISGIWDASSV
jgi:hypothetical protein